MKPAKILIAIALLFSMSFTAVFAEVPDAPASAGSNSDEIVPVFVPNTQGSNDNEGSGIIPSGQGSNGEEGTGIIPNGQGSNGDETPPPVDANVPHGPIVQGANGDETSSTTEEVATTPVVQGSNDQSRSSGGASASGNPVTIIPTTIPVPSPAPVDLASCTYLTDYLNIKGKNKPAEVTKLQTFLNEYEGITVPINGVYDQATVNGVKAFQTKYLNETMNPWGLQVPSGIVSYTTKKKINEIYCKAQIALTPDQLTVIENYKKGVYAPPQAPVTSPEEVTPTPPGVEVGLNPGDIELPLAIDTTPTPAPEAPAEISPIVPQTAAAADASPGFLQNILNFFDKIF